MAHTQRHTRKGSINTLWRECSSRKVGGLTGTRSEQSFSCSPTQPPFSSFLLLLSSPFIRLSFFKISLPTAFFQAFLFLMISTSTVIYFNQKPLSALCVSHKSQNWRVPVCHSYLLIFFLTILLPVEPSHMLIKRNYKRIHVCWCVGTCVRISVLLEQFHTCAGRRCF